MVPLHGVCLDASLKGARETFTLGLAKEVARKGIRVNCIRPRDIYAEMHGGGGEPDRVDRFKAVLSLKSLLT